MEQQDDKMQFNLDELKVLNRAVKYVGPEGVVQLLTMFLEKSRTLGNDVYQRQMEQFLIDIKDMD